MPIRWRLALVFAGFAAIAFSIGAYLFATGLANRLSDLLDSQLTAQLEHVDRSVSSHPATKESNASSTSVGPAVGEYFFQVLDPSGRIIAVSAEAGTSPLLTPRELRTVREQQSFFTKQVEGEHARVTAAPDHEHPGETAVAGVSLESIDRTLSDVRIELVLGGIVSVLIAGMGAYLLARRALQPVERMRAEVATLSARDRDATLVVPDTHDEVAALAVTMNQLLLRLQHSLARQRAFVADAGHELRNPFAVLQAELELASKPGRSTEELSEAVRNAADETARLSRLANDLLLLAQSDEDQMSLQRRDTDMMTLLGRTVAAAEPRSEALGVRVSLNIEPGLRAVVDGDRIRQAVDNLLDNGLRFAPHDSEIEVQARSDNQNDLLIEVLDHGPGFPDEFIAHAFERFRRPDSGRDRSAGGAGLGLAIVAAIALAHGGRAEAHNRPGGGALVSIWIPRAVLLESKKLSHLGDKR